MVRAGWREGRINVVCSEVDDKVGCSWMRAHGGGAWAALGFTGEFVTWAHAKEGMGSCSGRRDHDGEGKGAAGHGRGREEEEIRFGN